MENLKLSAIFLHVALLLNSTSTTLLAATLLSEVGDRNPIERQLIIATTCNKCKSEEGGDICCPA